MNNITLSVPVRSPIDRFLASITTTAGFAAWFTPHVHAEPKVGSLAKLGFGPDCPLGFKLDRLDPAGHVEWLCVDCPDVWLWKGTRLIFDAKVDGNVLQFTFSHTGLPAEYPMLAFLTYCWANHLRSLKLLLETGAGEPFGSAACTAWHPLG